MSELLPVPVDLTELKAWTVGLVRDDVVVLAQQALGGGLGAGFGGLGEFDRRLREVECCLMKEQVKQLTCWVLDRCDAPVERPRDWSPLTDAHGRRHRPDMTGVGLGDNGRVRVVESGPSARLRACAAAARSPSTR